MELSLRHGDVAVGDDAAEGGQTVSDGLVDDHAHHGYGGGELAVREADVGELDAGLGVVGAHGFAAYNITTVITLHGSCQEGGSGG